MTALARHKTDVTERIDDGIDVEASPMLITTEVITDTDQFRELRCEWNALLQACPSDCLFLTWEWTHTWWLHLAGKRKLHVIIVRCDGLLIGLAPLVLRPMSIKRLMPWRALEFLGSGSVGSDYLSFLIRPGYEEISMQEITAILDRSDHMLELVRIEKSAALMTDLAAKLQQSGWESASLTTNYAPYSTLSGHTWESYLDSLHSSHRVKLGKILRRLHNDFDVKLQRVASESERQQALEVFIRLHLRRWSEKGGSTALYKQELIDFHEAMSKLSLSEGWLRLYTLMLDDTPVASLYVFKYRNVFYYYQSAFDPEYSKYSVGTVTLALVIKDAIEEGAIEFDFLHDSEAYKHHWARHERELILLELYPVRKMVNVYRHSATVKQLIKRLVAKGLTYRNGTHDPTH